MKLLPILFSIFLTGCSLLVEHPKIVNSPYNPEEVNQGITIFLEEWEFPGDPTQIILQTTIEFREDVVLPNYGRVSGYTLNRTHIVVATTDKYGNPVLIFQTATWHELIHIALWEIEGNPDSNHEAPPGPWLNTHNNFVTKVKNILKLSLGF